MADMQRTWRFYEAGKNITIPDEDYREGVREALSMFSRYFQISFTELSGGARANYYVGFWKTSPLVGYGLAVADRLGQWYYRTPGVIYIDPKRNLVNRDQVRVLIAHEFGHMFSGAHHSADERDVMHINVRRDIPNFTRADHARIARYIQPRSHIQPWNDASPPWLAPPEPPKTYSWHNENRRWDINRDGKVDRKDLIDFLEWLSYPTVDHKLKPEFLGDVDNDGDVDAIDVRLVLRWLDMNQGPHK